jgi:hypothetical protein
MAYQLDELAKALAEGVSRREALRRVGVGLASAILTSMGLGQAAQAQARVQATCTCGGVTYNPVTQCCTRSGVQQKYPIVNLAACPNRVRHPGYVPQANGCGAAAGPKFPDRFPPGSPTGANFGRCCNAHDICWGTCNSNKSDCDSFFLDCLKDECRTAFLPLRPGQYTACLGAAQAYFIGVSRTGAGMTAYEAAQKDACDCCAGNTCSGGTCPQGQVPCAGSRGTNCCNVNVTCCDGDCCDPGQTCVSGVCTSSGGGGNDELCHSMAGPNTFFCAFFGADPVCCDKTLSPTCCKNAYQSNCCSPTETCCIGSVNVSCCPANTKCCTATGTSACCPADEFCMPASGQCTAPSIYDWCCKQL